MRFSPTWRVLVLDPQDEVRHTIQQCLAPDGYSMHFARSLDEAIALMDREPPDLLLTSLALDGIGGADLLHRLRQHSAGQLITIIAMIEQHELDPVLDALAAGANETMYKPFDQNELRVRVHTALAQKQLVNDLATAETILDSLAHAVESRDPHLGNHCERLRLYALHFGKTLKLTQDELRSLCRGAILHDLGKVAIPDSILLAPRKLTNDEWTVMRTHTLKGEEVCKPLRTMGTTLPIIRSHHERWDGSGYPDGLKGEQIPRLARYFQILDVFDALTNRRPYREPLSWRSAVGVLKTEEARGWYQPGLVDQWGQTLEQNPHLWRILEVQCAATRASAGA